MNTNLTKVLGAVVAVLFLSSPAIAEPNGSGDGNHHDGRAGAKKKVTSPAGRAPAVHSPGPARPEANIHGPALAHPNIGHPVGPLAMNRPLVDHPHPYYAHWYHGDWHDHWSHPWHYGPVAWVSVGVVTGAVVCTAPWHWGYWEYYNPYCTEVVVVDNVPVDYSRPIVLAAPAAAPPDSSAVASAAPAESEAARLLDVSRDAFAKGDYPAAMKSVNQAIAAKPNDPVPHEFRALVLFATKQYKPAAAAVYAILSVGPGWDWSTLCSFYPDVNLYSAQLRALEQYCNENPELPEARFLLAYHYMSCGHNEVAVEQLKEVARLNPKDQLSRQLVAGLSDAKAESPAAPAEPAVPAPPVSAASLAGDWEAARSGDASIAFSLTSQGTYRWQYTQNGPPQQFSGAYTLADNLLVLKNDGNPTMIGQITMLDPSRFNFKLVGANSSDPGLTFRKM